MPANSAHRHHAAPVRTMLIQLLGAQPSLGHPRTPQFRHWQLCSVFQLNWHQSEVTSCRHFHQLCGRPSTITLPDSSDLGRLPVWAGHAGTAEPKLCAVQPLGVKALHCDALWTKGLFMPMGNCWVAVCRCMMVPASVHPLKRSANHCKAQLHPPCVSSS